MRDADSLFWNGRDRLGMQGHGLPPRLIDTLLRTSVSHISPPSCSGTSPTISLSGEVRELKKVTVPGMMCLCKRVHQSHWTRRTYFARIRCVLQEAKDVRARSRSMIASANAIAVGAVNSRSVPVGERCLRGCANPSN